MIPALILFAAASVLMLVFSKYRPYIALGAALIFIATGMLPLGDILPSIDLNVLLMIAGTMGLVALFIDSRMPELLARIRAALRYSRPGTPHGRLPESRFRLHDLEIEYETRTVAIGG